MSWTYIENNNIDDYINQYPTLREYWEAYELAKNETITFLPRYFSSSYPSNYLIDYDGKKEGKVEKIDAKLKRNLKLRPKQQEAYNTILKLYKKQNYVNGILKLPPGSGKTVLAIYIAVKFQIKTAVIVDNKKLLKQWIKAILEYTDLTEEDIGLISQKTISYENKKIILCMGQTLGSHIKKNIQKIFNEVDKARIGLVFFDEVHTTSDTELNAKISLLFRTKNIMGLSATPFHIGYQKILMNNTIGDIIFESSEYEIVPDCYVQYFNSGLTRYNYIYKIKDFNSQRATYNKIIVQSESYFNIIIEIVTKMKQENKNAQILIIAMTLNQVQLITDKLSEYGFDSEQLTGHQAEISDDCDLIVGTYKFCNKGLDIPKLNCLLIATPLSGKKSYLQTSGRMARSSEGKTKATVVSLFDSNFMNLFLPDVKRIENIVRDEHGIKLKSSYL